MTCFLTEEEIRGVARALYDWAPPGSKMYATFETKTEGLITPKLQKLLDMFEQMGSPYQFLTVESSRELVKPWAPGSRGFRRLDELLDTVEPTTDDDREGVGLEFYGAILER